MGEYAINAYLWDEGINITKGGRGAFIE